MKNKNKDEASEILVGRRQLIKWAPPILAVVCLPAHAQTSVVPLPSCPNLNLGNLISSPGSAPGTCGMSFQILSGDSTQSIDILSINNSSLMMSDLVNYPTGTSGEVTETSGLTIIWVGQAVGAPFACSTAAPVPINNITFTITYNCSFNPEIQTTTFTLLEAASI